MELVRAAGHLGSQLGQGTELEVTIKPLFFCDCFYKRKKWFWFPSAPFSPKKASGWGSITGYAAQVGVTCWGGWTKVPAFLWTCWGGGGGGGRTQSGKVKGDSDHTSLGELSPAAQKDAAVCSTCFSHTFSWFSVADTMLCSHCHLSSWICRDILYLQLPCT